MVVPRRSTGYDTSRHDEYSGLQPEVQGDQTARCQHRRPHNDWVTERSFDEAKGERSDRKGRRKDVKLKFGMT